MAVDQPLGHGPADAGGVGDPDRLGDPEALDVRGLAQQRQAVGGEGEQAVDALLDLGLARGGQQGPASRSRRRAKSSSVNCRTDGIAVGLVDGQDVVGVDRHRAVAVVADAEPVEALAVVEVGVLVAQDRADRLLGLARPAPGPGRSRQLVGSGVSGRFMPTMRAIFGPQMPAQHTTMSAGISPWSVTTPVTRPSLGADVEDLVAGQEAHAALRWPGGAAPRRRGRPWRGRRWGRGGRRGPGRGSSSGCSATHSSAVEQPGLDAPGGDPAVPAVQFGERARGWWPPRGRRPGGSRAARRRRGSRTSRRCSGPTRSWSWRSWSGRPGPGRATTSRPVAGSGPWSTTVTSVQPRADSSSASAAPDDAGSDDDHSGSRHRRTSDLNAIELLSAQHASGCATQCACHAERVSRGPCRRPGTQGRQTATPGGRRAARSCTDGLLGASAAVSAT